MRLLVQFVQIEPFEDFAIPEFVSLLQKYEISRQVYFIVGDILVETEKLLCKSQLVFYPFVEIEFHKDDLSLLIKV